MKIVVIGAGSRVFGPRCLNDVLGTPAMRDLAPELVLVDVDPKGLDSMLKLGRMLKAHYKSKSKLWATTDRVEAMKGADYVMISVTQKRYQLWEQDYRVPMSYGFYTVYAENGGPGSVFHTLRNLHLIMPMVKDMERLCPDALLFNYSNPESRVILGVYMMTNIRGIGICHGQGDAQKVIAGYLKKKPDELDILAGGINHLYWLYEIKDKKTGKDLYPAVRKAMAKDNDPHHNLAKKMLEIYGILTYPSTTHCGEFLQWGPEFVNWKWPHGLESRSVDTPHGSTVDRLAPYIAKQKPIKEIAVISPEISIPMMLAHRLNKPERFMAGNVLNDKLYVPNLLPDGVVEVPIDVDGSGFHPVTLPPLPDGPAALCRTQMAIQKLSVEAYRQRSKKLILQALLCDPAVNSISKAEKLIEDMLRLQRDYLPEFK